MSNTNLEHYLKKWDLSAPTLIAQTHAGDLFHVRRCNHFEAVLKILNTQSRVYESQNAAYLKIAAPFGAINILEHDEGASLLPFLDGPTLRFQTPYNDEHATKIIGNLLVSLHRAAPQKNAPFETLKDRCSLAFTPYCEKKGTPSLIITAWNLARHMIKHFPQDTLLHGDMHHDNVMFDNKRQRWVVIDPQPLIGDPAYDCANSFKNPLDRSDLTHDPKRLLKQADLFADILHIDPRRIINYAFIHGCISSCWSQDDKGTPFEELDAFHTSRILEHYITEDLKP
jgi:streptomycin 6-kinase